MSLEKPRNQRMELYERFRDSLSNPADEQFFDADDLAIIIDQAVDIDDYYVQLAATMRGYRYFPDNEELKVRLGFLFDDLHMDQGVSDMVSRNPEVGGTPLWDILNFFRESADYMPSDPRAIKWFDGLLAKYTGEFDDETIIRLVDAATSTGCLQWLLDHEKDLRKRCTYLPTLLYELACSAADEGKQDVRLRLLEELTEIEPFTVDFWTAYGQALIENQDAEGTLVAADYALAIDEQNVQAQMHKATALYALDRYEEILRIFAPQLDESHAPNDGLMAIGIRSMLQLGRPEEARKLLRRALFFFPDDPMLLDIALEQRLEGLDEMLRRYIGMLQPDGIEQLMLHAVELHNRGQYYEAAQIAYSAFSIGKITDSMIPIMVTDLYLSGSYEQVCSMLEKSVSTPDGEDDGIMCVELAVLGLLASARIQTKAESRVLYHNVLAKLPIPVRRPWTPTTTLCALSLNTFLSIFGNVLKGRRKIDIDSLDIFTPQTPNDQI